MAEYTYVLYCGECGKPGRWEADGWPEGIDDPEQAGQAAEVVRVEIESYFAKLGWRQGEDAMCPECLRAERERAIMAEEIMEIAGLFYFDSDTGMRESIIEGLNKRRGPAKVWVMGPDGQRKLCPVIVVGRRLVVAFSAATSHLCKVGQFITKPVDRVQRVGFTYTGHFWVLDLGPDTDEPWELVTREELGIVGPDRPGTEYLGLA